MTAEYDTLKPSTELQHGACGGPWVDPEWWVGDHGGYGHHNCHHQDARHICIAHCTVRQACQRVAADFPDLWLGMVIAGELRTGRNHSNPSRRGPGSSKKPGGVSPVAPTLQCHLCLLD